MVECTHFLACQRCGSSLLPPAWQHAQYTNDQPRRKCAQDNEDEGCSPLLSKEESNIGIVLVIESKCKQGKKNGYLKCPLKEPCNVFQVKNPRCGSDSNGESSGLGRGLQL